MEVLLPSSDEADRSRGKGGPENAPPATHLLSRAQIDAASWIRAAGNDPVPERLGKYRISRVLGKGGMGIVYLAEQEQPVRRHVAIKLIQPAMDSREVLARFEAERQALAMLDHPSVARVFDAGVSEGGLPYFVMEYVDGVPFHDYCDRNRLSVRARLELFVPLCEALHHAHLKGIIHRDVKPSNVLVTLVDGRPLPKLIDFGLAKATEAKLTDKTLSTQLGQILGTPAYMSPEQIVPTGAGIDAGADVYSLGVMLYQLLTGMLPFDIQRISDLGYRELQRLIVEVDPPRPSVRMLESGNEGVARAHERGDHPSSIGRQLRGDLDWITMRAMEKERSRRYPSALALAEDLRRHLRSEPVLAGPPSFSYRFGKLVKRKPMHAVLAAVLAVLLPLGGWLGLRSLEQHRRLTDIQVGELTHQLNRAGTDPARLFELSGKILALRPENTDALRALAAAHFDAALHGEAGSKEVEEHRRLSLEVSDRLIRALPGHAWPFLRKTYYLQKYGRTEEAERWRGRAPTPANKEPDDDYFEALDILEREPQTDADRKDALERLNRVVLSGERKEAVERRARLRYEMGDLEGALDDYRIETQMHSDDYFPHRMMAPVLRKLGRYQEADDHLKRSLELAERHAPPHRWEVHLARSNNFYEWSVHLEKKRPDEARERAGEAEREARAGLALAPEEPELHLNLGSTLMRRRLLESPPGPTLLEEAIREFDTALALAGKLGDKKKVREANRAQTALCDAFLGLGDVERAMPYCRQGVVVVPGDPVSHYNLAGALALSGKKDEAFAALEKDFELGDFEYEYLAADRWFESLKGDPRFKDLLGRMKARAKSKAED